MTKTLFGLTFSRAAAGFLDAMPHGKIRAQLAKKAKSLIANIRPMNCKKLKGLKEGDDPVWRIRSGDYRILYSVRDNEVLILDIDNRKDVYKK
jgi:mRNA interferase RelE/StbE